MRFLAFASCSLLLAVVALTPRSALASNPIGGCTEQTFEAACNHDGTSPCSGVCLPDYSQQGTPMACMPADTMVRDDDGLISSVEGYACSPTGAVGTDCTHTCKSGQCVETNAQSGAECIPADGGVNVCNGACDGNGGCTLLLHDSETYGPDPDQCSYTACRPLSNSSESGFSPFIGFVPAGTACNNNEQCDVDDKCTAAGECVGTIEPDCTPDYGDSGAYGDAGADDAGTERADAKSSVEAGMKDDAGKAGTTGSSGGCNVGGAADFGAFSMGPLLALMGWRRRSRRGRRS
jgi:hypothetical protein